MRLSIPIASDGFGARLYHAFAMQKPIWKQWGKRYRTELVRKHLKLSQIAERMDMAESSIRSWVNGTREINLVDFFRICAVAGIEPKQVLFEDQEIPEGESDNKALTLLAVYRDTDDIGRAVIDTAIEGARQRGHVAKRRAARAS